MHSIEEGGVFDGLAYVNWDFTEHDGEDVLYHEMCHHVIHEALLGGGRVRIWWDPEMRIQGEAEAYYGGIADVPRNAWMSLAATMAPAVLGSSMGLQDAARVAQLSIRNKEDYIKARTYLKKNKAKFERRARDLTNEWLGYWRPRASKE